MRRGLSIKRVPGVVVIAVMATMVLFATPERLRSQGSTLFRGRVDLVNVAVTVADKLTNADLDACHGRVSTID